VKKPGADGNVFDAMIEQMFSSEDSPLDYATDIKPWFDKRAAVAGFTDRDGKPTVVGIIRSKDDGKAKAALDKAKGKPDGGDFAYRIEKGYVLLADTQAIVDDARGAGRQGVAPGQRRLRPTTSNASTATRSSLAGSTSAPPSTP
jgi:hypothetical protein